jgi:hypothetical protein
MEVSMKSMEVNGNLGKKIDLMTKLGKSQWLVNGRHWKSV